MPAGAVLAIRGIMDIGPALVNAWAERRGPSVVWTVGVQIEIEGKEKPALVGEVVYMAAGVPPA